MPRYYKKRKYSYVPRAGTRNYRKKNRNKYTSTINRLLKKKVPKGVRSVVKRYAGVRKYKSRYTQPRHYSTMRNRIRWKTKASAERRKYLGLRNPRKFRIRYKMRQRLFDRYLTKKIGKNVDFFVGRQGNQGAQNRRTAARSDRIGGIVSGWHARANRANYLKTNVRDAVFGRPFFNYQKYYDS